MTREEFKAKVSMAFADNNTWEDLLEAVWQLHLEASNHWIPVEEKLPKVDEQTTLSNDCVVVDSAGARYFGYYNGTDECWYTDDYTMILFVTHWMPLPETPRKEDKE